MGQNKETAKEVLQKLVKKYSAQEKETLTKSEITVILSRATESIEKNQILRSNFLNKIGCRKVNQKGFADITAKLSETLYSIYKISRSSNDISRKTLEKLLFYYFAAVNPDKLNESINIIKAYKDLSNPDLVKPDIFIKQQSESNIPYLFYFWNHEIYDIEIGLLLFSTTSQDQSVAEWERGSLFYFAKDTSINKEIPVWKQKGAVRPLKVSPKSKNLDTITIISGEQNDVNFYTESDRPFFSSFRILIKEEKVEDRKIMMGSYSVAISDGSNPTSGIGIFVRIGENGNYNKYPLINKDDIKEGCLIIEKVGKFTVKHRVPDEITNILFDRRDSLREIISYPNNISENRLFEAFDELPNFSHINAIKELAGLYFGYHLQNDYGRPGTKKIEKGALRTFVLEIHTSGICYLLDDEEKNPQIIKPYFGFLSMKDYRNRKMLINIDREHEKYIEYHSWRLQFYLELKPSEILEGVMSGFSKSNYSPITSPVRFKKVNDLKSLAQFLNTSKETYLLKTIFPSTFYKSDYPQLNHHIDLERLLEWDEKAIPYFVSINNNRYFNSPNQSLPHNFINIEIEEYNRFKRLIGNYYLISHSHSIENNSISKVKVQLRNFGEAFFIYPEETDQSLFDVFIGRWEMHENGQLLKIRLKYRKRLAKKISGLITTQPQSQGDFIFQLNNITNIDNIDFLRSISVWVDYEKENTILAKREFLFPASSIEISKQFPDDFIEGYQYKYPISDFEKNRFYKGIRYFETSSQEINEKRKAEFFELIKSPENNIIMTNKSINF